MRAVVRVVLRLYFVRRSVGSLPQRGIAKHTFNPPELYLGFYTHNKYIYKYIYMRNIFEQAFHHDCAPNCMNKKLELE